MVKRALYWAPKRARLIAYKALCLPHLEYASAAWDPNCKKDGADLERMQIYAIRFITDAKGRDLKGAIKKNFPYSLWGREEKVDALVFF